MFDQARAFCTRMNHLAQGSAYWLRSHYPAAQLATLINIDLSVRYSWIPCRPPSRPYPASKVSNSASSTGHKTQPSSKGRKMKLTTLLDTPKRTLTSTQQTQINTHHPHLQRLRDPPHPWNILRDYETSQPNITIIRHLDRFVFSVEFVQPYDGREGLFARGNHLARHVFDYCGLEEVAFQVAFGVGTASEDDLTAMFFRVCFTELRVVSTGSLLSSERKSLSHST